ncbi:uncharacterized protein [Haliotis asinina]|uniref:uncharacterized protein isoform X2 n=1 Tax=Haliotis asinina TaxID=109174 RepID=UPI0035327FF9
MTHHSLCWTGLILVLVQGNVTAMAIMTMAIFFVMTIVAVWAGKHYLEKTPTNKGSDSPPGSPQIDPRFDRSIDVHCLTGAKGSDRYILAQLPSTKELDENFLRMVCDHDIKVIVFISSNGRPVFESYLRFWNIPGRKAESTIRDDRYELWTLTLSQNGTRTTTHLYHHCKWFNREYFCDFMKDVRKNPGYHKEPIVVCSSEGEDSRLVFCILDCLMDKNPPREGIVEELNECVKRLALERAELGNKGKNKKRLRECCEYVLPPDNDETHQEMQSGVNVEQSSKKTIPPFCLFGSIVLPFLFAIIVCAIIAYYA